MGKKRLLCGLMVLMLLWWGTAAQALTSRSPEHPNNPDPGTCSVFPFVGNLQQPFAFSFALILSNYLGTTETFQVFAFIGGTILRSINITLNPDEFRGLGPGNIPILLGETADLFICWAPGSPTFLIPPGVLLLVSFAGSWVAETPINFFLP